MREFRRYSPQQGFDNRIRKIDIPINSLLDATSINKNNISIISDGSAEPSEIKEVTYLPLENILRCGLDSRHAILSEPCFVTTSGLKTVDGVAADFSGDVLVSAEYIPELYDASILSVAYVQNGVLTYRQPRSGECEVKVTLVNSAKDAKTLTLAYSALNSDLETEEILFEKQIDIGGETKITDVCRLIIDEQQRINVYIKK